MEVSGKRADNLSELCDTCQSKQATGFCKDCNEYMCQRCFQNHTTAKPCRHHVLSQLDKLSDLMSRKTHGHEEKCKVHKTENIRYYCRKHNTVGCGDCLVSKHVGCKAEIIKDLALKFEESVEFREFLRRLDECDAGNKENTKSVERNIRQNKELIDKALDEIGKFRKEINAYIDRVENDVISEANKRFKDNEILFAQLHQMIEEVSKEIDDIREQVDTRVHQDEDLFIRVVECKSREAVVQQTVAEIKSRNILKTYIFLPEQKLKDLLTSIIRLGTIQFMENNEKQVTFEKAANVKEQRSERPYTPKQPHAAETKYYPPVDPRSAGYDVGKRVRWYLDEPVKIRPFRTGTGTGTIVSVDPSGWVEVSWDQGKQGLERAGAEGQYWVKLV